MAVTLYLNKVAVYAILTAEARPWRQWTSKPVHFTESTPQAQKYYTTIRKKQHLQTSSLVCTSFHIIATFFVRHRRS